MKPLPPGLPPASSSKWHARRMWDPLGYLRVRSLANPAWRRDLPWLISWLRRQMPPVGHELRAVYEPALAAAQRYPRTHAGAVDTETSWDELLGCIDDILLAVQRAHLDLVRQAGCSGKDVPPAEPNPRPTRGSSPGPLPGPPAHP